MNIVDLIPTQEQFRNWKNIEKLRSFLISGGQFTVQDNRNDIQISIDRSDSKETKYYIHNGHHRLIALWLAGRMELAHSEYRSLDWSYRDYLTFQPEIGFVMTFDPRSEVRIGEWHALKKEILRRYDDPNQGLEAALDFRNQVHHRYTEQRTIDSLADLASFYQRMVSNR